MFNKAQSLAKYESFFIPIIYFLILILLSPIHNTFDEWGGVMQFFAGQEIFSGLGYYGWAAGFWPPLYSILIGVGSKFTNGFDAGKLISIFSATILIYVIYQLSQELTGRRTTSLLAQLFLALSPIFVFQSIDVHNHMLDSLLLASGIWLFIKSSNKQKLWIYFLTGLVCGLAALTRFTSYILLILPFFSFIFDHALGKFFRRACAFWIGSLIILGPWLFYNLITNGSPLYSLENLNICSGVIYGNIHGTNLSLWMCVNNHYFDGIFTIFRNSPTKYLLHVANNIVDAFKLLVDYGGILVPLTFPGVFEVLFSNQIRKWSVVLGVMAIYIFMVSQAFISEWYLLGWMPVVIILAVIFLENLFRRLNLQYLFFQKYHLR